MKIAIFSDNFLPGVGGTENAVNNFASELAKDNQVLVVAPNYHKQFDDSNFSYKVVRAKSILVTKNDFCAIPFLDRKLKKELNVFKPDIIQTETIGPIGSFGAKFAKKNNIPLVSTVHTKYRYCYRRATHLRLLSEILVKHFSKFIKKANRIITVSNDMKCELASYGIKKQIEVIKNGSIKRNNDFTKELTQNNIFLFVGLVVKYKNIKFSLDALKIVKERGVDFTFNIVGDGQDKKHFEKYVKKIGLQNNVRFVGRLTDKRKIDEEYAKATLFLFSSIFDNDPLVVVEAGNVGTPSLVIENTGASERIENNVSGFTCQNNVQKFAERIIEIIGNRELLNEVGENAKTLMTTWEDCTKSYLNIYKQLLNENEVEKWKYSKNLKNVG